MHLFLMISMPCSYTYSEHFSSHSLINAQASHYLLLIIFSGKIVPTNCLWVGNIPMDMKRRDLEQAFARYGQIKSCDYETGDPAAIVTFNEIEDAIKARAKMVGVTQITDGKKVRADSGQSDSSRRGELISFFLLHLLCWFV